MTDARSSRDGSGRRAGARGGFWLLMLALPLTLGARECERVVVGEGCDGGTCAGTGAAGGGGTAGGGDIDAGGREPGCVYAGRRYAVGDTFPSEDGCNECRCQRGGEVACTLRECANRCGGLTGARCPRGQYCNYPRDAQCGAADQTGFCEPIPQQCRLQYAPVCGCDDVTYGNACEAAANGVSVAHEGECAGGTPVDGGVDAGSGEGADCGGLLGRGCPDGQYCNYPLDARCGAADQTGTCTVIPQACTREYNPVCGCDDVTYPNPCAAASEGVSIARRGECEPSGGGSGQTCGGIASLECSDPGEFCNYEPGAGGQGCDGTISDAAGVCAVRPQACTLEYNPVCGCDRRTYGNACAAHGAGVSVLHRGECTEIDCAAIGGHPVDGLGPAPMCPQGETSYGPIRYSNGAIAIEGTICCVP